MSWRDRVQRARAAWWLRVCERVGHDPVITGTPSIYGAPGRIVIGDRFHLSSRPVASHLAAGPDALLTIGDDVRIAQGAAIAAYERVTIGARTCIGPFAVIMDTNFHGSSGDQSVQHECRPVMIGSDCCIGSRVTIMRGVTIGDGAEVLAGSVVSSSVPAGMCAGGARARVLGRAKDRASRWDAAPAMLLETVREELGLDATPDLESALAELPGWNAAQGAAVIASLERHFRISLDPSIVMRADRLSDIAAGVEGARRVQ